MFAIINNKLMVAEPNDSRSHTRWFLDSGWIQSEYDEVFEEIVRGYAYNGGLFVYRGRYFSEDGIIQTLMGFIIEIAEKLFLSPTSNVWLGAIPGAIGEVWAPKSYAGSIQELVEHVS